MPIAAMGVALGVTKNPPFSNSWIQPCIFSVNPSDRVNKLYGVVDGVVRCDIR